MFRPVVAGYPQGLNTNICIKRSVQIDEIG